MNILNRSEFNCPLKCKEIITYEKYKKHLEICQNLEEKVTCLYCKENVYFNNDFLNHEEVCKELRANCPFCNKVIMKIDYEGHLNLCKNWAFICEKCESIVPFKYKVNHDDYFCKEFCELRNEFNELVDILK